nr:response regulator [Tissierella sp.]
MMSRILIVDDEKNIRMTLKHCLLEQNYKIDEAVNGDEGLKKILDENFDLVLLDINMPGLTGMEVLKAAREKGNNVDVIMMTAYGTIDRAVDAMKLGAIDFISKPFTPDDIRRIVNDVLKREHLKANELETYDDIISFSKKCIVDKDYSKAEEYLKKSMAIDVILPEPHNLLGVLAEYKGEVELAQKHYRAALALDPTYTPADHNLERTTHLVYTRSGIETGIDKA